VSIDTALVALVEFSVIVVLISIVANQHTRTRDLEAQIESVTKDLEIETEWCEYWQTRTEAQYHEIAALAAKHSRLQALYAERTVEMLKASSWIVLGNQRRRTN
jgi:hypothetical protein